MFPVGTEVYYEDFTGVIRFCCEQYVTVCVQTFPDRVRDVCIIVYKENYNQLQLATGNHLHEL